MSNPILVLTIHEEGINNSLFTIEITEQPGNAILPIQTTLVGQMTDRFC